MARPATAAAATATTRRAVVVGKILMAIVLLNPGPAVCGPFHLLRLRFLVFG